MNHLDHNIEVLRLRDPKLAERVSGVVPIGSRLIPLSNGLYDLEIDSRQIYRGDPKGMVAQFWQGQKLGHPTLLVFYGMDLGYHIQHYLEQAHAANRAVLVIEKSLESFRLALTMQDWSKYLNHEGISWLIGQDVEQAYLSFVDYFLTVNHLCYSASMENIMWLPSMEQDGAYYVRMAEALKRGSEAAVTRLSGPPEDHYYGLRNMLGNIDHLAKKPFVDSLRNLFKGRPGIIISSGPSLDQSLPYLRGVRDKAVLIAAESSVRVLLNAGIVPHFVACLERFIATEQIIGDLPELSNTWLITLPIVYPGTIAGYRGPQMFLCSRGTRYQWLLGNSDIPNHYLGFSVANMSFVVLDLLGCDPIILLGQDLAYERNSRRSHAAGTLDFLKDVGIHEEKEAFHEGDANWVNGNDGQLILSSRFYRLTAACFEDLVRNSHAQCMNAIFPEYGMKLAEPIRQILPTDLMKYCQEPVDVVALVHQQLNEKTLLASSLKIQRSRLHDVRQNLACLCQRMLQEMKRLSDFCFSHPPDFVPIDPTFVSEYRQEFDRLERTCFVYSQESFIVSFFWPFLVATHLRCLAKYYEMSGGKIPFEKQVIAIPMLFQEWFQEVYIWASRVNDLLEEFVKEGADTSTVGDKIFYELSKEESRSA